jgi:hypothetical protein
MTDLSKTTENFRIAGVLDKHEHGAIPLCQPAWFYAISVLPASVYHCQCFPNKHHGCIEPNPMFGKIDYKWKLYA